MPDKQERYRKRNAEQGLQRVEVIVPEELAPYLKAYARALRDARALGLEPPLFEGLLPASTQPTPQADTAKFSQTAQQHSAPEHVETEPLTATPSRQRKPEKTVMPRPDFSKGLFDE